MSKFEIIGKTKASKEILTRNLINLIQGRLITIKDEISAIDNDLDEWRKKYRLSDEEFYRRFEKGEIGDDLEYFNWDASINLKKRLIDEEAQMRELL
jgi:hypothetical protein